jgi:hypothetical protein
LDTSLKNENCASRCDLTAGVMDCENILTSLKDIIEFAHYLTELSKFGFTSTTSLRPNTQQYVESPIDYDNLGKFKSYPNYFATHHALLNLSGARSSYIKTIFTKMI